MKKTAIIILVSALFATYANAQKWSTILGGNKVDTEQTEDNSGRESDPAAGTVEESDKENREININVDTRHFPNVSRYDHALYQHVTKQNGFWKGIGRPLTAAEASHLSCYYRLSRSVGHERYVYMQSLNAKGDLTTNHTIGTYLGRANDDDISDTWSSKLDEVCQWEVLYCDNGVIQENAYDKDGDMVFQYHPMATGVRKIHGHFTDASGNPVNFRGSDSPVKGVYIEQDVMGYDSIIAFIDANNQYVRNSDGAFISKRIHDQQGNVVCNMSCNPFGEPMIDDWGNCGWTATHDARGNELMSTYIDTEGNPMRMPEKKSGAVPVITQKYTYDRYGRYTECRYYDQNMQPDTTATGVHLWRITYDAQGNRTSCANYRLDGTTPVNDTDGWARWENNYDRRGNLIREVMYDADGNFINQLRGGDCLHLYRYEGDKRVLREDYNTTNGTDTTLNWRVASGFAADTTFMLGSGKIEVESYDRQHRLVADAYYDSDMQPITGYGDWHRWQKTYVEDATHSRATTVFYLPDGTEMERTDEGTVYTRQVVETDSTTRIKTTSYYLGNRLVKREGAEYDPTFSYSTALISYDAMGMPARSNIPTFGNTGLFNRVVPLRNSEGDAVAWRCENEFGEPTYIQFGDWENASRWVSRTGNYLLDEHNDSISSDHNPWDRVPKAFYIEVIDSTALQLGLRSGDILMRYGDWHYSQPDSVYHRYYENTLVYETVDRAMTEKPVVVMRHNPEDGTSNLVSLTLPQGTPRQLGFQYHIIYMTEREAQRYNHTVKLYAMTNELSRSNVCQQGEGTVWFFVPYKVGDADDIEGYTNGLNENGIILAFMAYRDEQTYAVAFDDPNIDLDKVTSAGNDSTVIYYTTDGHTVKNFTMTSAPYQYGRSSYTSMMPENAALHLLADSLMSTLPPLPHDSTMRTPEEAMHDIYMLSAGKRDEVEGREGWLKYIYKTGLQPPRGADSCQHVWIALEESTIADILATEDMLTHIDWTGYTCIPDSSNTYSFYLQNDSTATELYRISDNNIEHFTGTFRVPFNLIVLEAIEDGFMDEQGYHGKYALIAVNGWSFGQSITAYNSARNNSSHIIIAPITETANGYKLGKNITLNTDESLGTEISIMQADYRVFSEVLKRAQKLSKAKKR